MIDERSRDLIQADLDGALDPQEQAELELLLAQSDEARRLHSELRELARVLRQLPEPELPAGLRDRILGQVRLPREDARVVPFRLRELPTFVRYGFAAAAGLLLAVGVYEYRSQTPDAQDLNRMVGSIMPGEGAVQETVIDRFTLDTEALATEAVLQLREGALVLDVRFEHRSAGELALELRGDGLAFDAIAQTHSELSEFDVTDRAVHASGQGRQEFAVLMHRDGDQADGDPAVVRLAYYSSDGALITEGALVVE
ncbi:MAG: hypothetical protein GTN86_02950 [Xanthomonadales bacterium]|nr:hypothetical protein [Xanthomonadales bacterium]NIN58971.1 hypothetical protein [Xanthomonadales bacterium]NIN74236.1 hypothetical protein [Xanthomonadales bacterium]NIO13909.1 hypothetical protein [Xanthomonadales bacterium]NIP11364.1 hypothetical protein [Xanthomonadales bacterium]